MLHFIITWVKEDDSLERRILIVVYLNILEGLDQLIQHSVCNPTDLWLRTVPGDHAAVTCRTTSSSQRLWGPEGHCENTGLRVSGWEPLRKVDGTNLKPLWS